MSIDPLDPEMRIRHHFTDRFTIGDATIRRFGMDLFESTDSLIAQGHPTLSLCRKLSDENTLAIAIASRGLINSAAYSVVLSPSADRVLISI